jgi:hypothetical protein
MPENVTDTALAVERARVVLLQHLWVALGGRWPGADGLTEGDVLLSYPLAAAAGRVPTREELHRRHPELASELDRLLGFGGPVGAPR